MTQGQYQQQRGEIIARPGEELTQLWTLITELTGVLPLPSPLFLFRSSTDETEQLALNQAVVKQLKERSENVKGQAAHAGAGFPLRRFNLDISDGQSSRSLGFSWGGLRVERELMCRGIPNGD